MTVLILAAGEGTRWGKVTNKVLVDVNGEPLISRTVRMARDIFSPSIPCVVTQHRDIDHEIPWRHIPTERRWTVETLLSTKDLWKDRVIVLLGDTYYTERTLNLIKHTDKPLAYFGQLLEIYAMSFRDHLLVERLLRQAIVHAERGNHDKNRPGRLWHTWYAVNGHSMDEHTMPGPGDSRFIRLFDNDITMDVDKPEDYEELCRRIQT